MIDEQEGSLILEETFDRTKDVAIILEDSIPNLNILRRILEKLNYSVLTGENGYRGIDLLKLCAKEKLNLTIIISDIMMPKMDGLEFLGHVKKTQHLSRLPFVFVTAASDVSNVLEAKKLGITSYLLKPVTMEKISEKLKELFPKREIPFSKRKTA